jgi:uncharacterized Tic20 family protein
MENPTSDEKVLAALAHASVLFSFFGPVAPTLIWVFQRNKSKYVRFHALQAMGYQSFLFWGWFIGLFVVIFGVVFVMVLIDAVLMETKSATMPLTPFVVQPIIILFIFGIWGLFFLGGFIGAFFCMTNRDCKYPLIGHWLSNRLLSDKTTETESEDWEDSWVSGICHATAIIQMWGVITPLIVWFSQKERSAKIRFQALQAVFYQLLATAVYLFGMFGYMLVFFLFFAGIVVLRPTSGTNQEVSNVFGIIMLLFFGVFMIFWFFLMFAVPVYYLIAAVATVMTARGRNFKYPILGTVIYRRINSTKASEKLEHEST